LIKRKPAFSRKMFWSLEIPFKTGFTVFEQKKMKSRNKQHFVENRTQIMQHVLKCSKFPSCLNIEN